MSEITPTTTASTTPKKILIIEDDKFLRDIVLSHLTKAGFEVTFSVTGEEALTKARELCPDLIILDIVLSGINGLDVMARLQQKPTMKDIPFIVFSNSDEAASVSRGKGLGAVKYMIKALSTPDQIVKEVTEFFAQTTPAAA